MFDFIKEAERINGLLLYILSSRSESYFSEPASKKKRNYIEVRRDVADKT